MDQPNTKDLERRLSEVIQKQKSRDREYRNANQQFWTIAFIDCSESAKPLWAFGESVANTILQYYQQRARAILAHKKACFIEPGGGPQIVCCFQDPAPALLAMDLVMKGMEDWNQEQEEPLRLTPSIGAHQGYVHYYDNMIHQSNTNNMAKRIQTQALPGQLLISSGLKEALQNDPRFSIEFSHTAELKNIPEPQDIYEARVVGLQEELDFNSLPAQIEGHATEGGQSRKNDPGGRETHQWLLVYIDVCESTKKFWKYGDREASELIREYQSLCTRAFERHGCAFAASSEGDQIFAGFGLERSDDALAACVFILQNLFKRNINVPQNRQVRAAIGAHFGQAITQNGALIQTNDMRVGKMIQSEAQADDLLISSKVRALVSPRWSADLAPVGFCGQDVGGAKTEIFRLNWFNMRKASERIHLRDPNQTR